MLVPLAWVDAFTDRPFAGNPAAVCLLEAWPPDEAMQAVAAELALSETAFVCSRPDADGWDLRWFTPAAEIDLCGHATLATAHTLWSEQRAPGDQPLRFQTRSGVLTATALAGGWIELDFPARPPVPVDLAAHVAAALGVEVVSAAASPEGYLVVEVPSPEAVTAVVPDLDVLATTEQVVMVTAAGGPEGADYVVRVFAPSWGIPEDPVTGAAQCALGPFWAGRLGKDRLLARQLSARGGVLRTRVTGDRVGIAGQAVTVFEGRVSVTLRNPQPDTHTPI